MPPIANRRERAPSDGCRSTRAAMPHRKKVCMAGSPLSSHAHEDRARTMQRRRRGGRPGDWIRCPQQLSVMALVVCTHRVLRVRVRECRGNKGMASGGHQSVSQRRRPRCGGELPTGHVHSRGHAGAGRRLMSGGCHYTSAGWRVRVDARQEVAARAAGDGLAHERWAHTRT